MTRLDESQFRAGIDATPLGETVFPELHTTPVRVARRPEEIARPGGEYAILILQQSGTMIVAQDGREARLDPGAATIVDTTRSYAFCAPVPIRQIVPFRLDRCREDLEDRRQRARSITEIALRWGFNDSAHFSRVFKARFGVSPCAVRRQNG